MGVWCREVYHYPHLRYSLVFFDIRVWCREALLRAAGSPELFLSMRAAFTASLATVSMGGYIAGVGDRHMDNYLLDLSSGALIPIDFG